jgi:hypothetical protein
MARHEEEEWQKAYAAAFAEQDAKKRTELCENARRLILDKQIELAGTKSTPDPSLEEALQKIWLLQEQARKSLE